MDSAQTKKHGGEKTEDASLLDSAPSDSSDDSGPVLTAPPNRLGGAAIGDFGGRSCCTFRSGLRSSSEHLPGYSLLPHLYEDGFKIASGWRNTCKYETFGRSQICRKAGHCADLWIRHGGHPARI